MIFVLLQRSGLGHTDVKDSLKPLNAKIWEGAQCYSKISVSVAARPALLVQPLTVKNGLWICLVVLIGYFSGSGQCIDGLPGRKGVVGFLSST